MRRVVLSSRAAMGTRPRRVVTSAATAPQPSQRILTLWVQENGESVELEVKETALSLASAHAKAAAASMSQGELSRVIVHAHAAEAASRSIPETNKYRGPHPLYLRAIELLADAYEEQGDRKALSYRCELCAHNETSLGTEHLFTLTATKKMASLLADGGELERARPLLEKAVETCRCSRHMCMSLDAHAVYLDCSSLLAQAHVCGGRTAQATSLLVRNVASAIKVHGTQSAVTGKVMDALVSHGVSTYVHLMG